ncbi:MAG: putative Ig domain-containing protein [Pelovirga sp.]
MKRKMVLLSMVLLVLGLGVTSAVWAKTATLSWEASPSEVLGYNIYYKAGSDDLSRAGDAGTLMIDVGNVLTYSLSDLDPALDYYFAVTAYDADRQESEFSNLVHSPAAVAVNNPPVFDPIGNKTVIEGALLTFVVAATDEDGDSLNFTTSELPGGAEFSTTTQTFSWIPGMNQAGNYNVSFTVSDGQASDSETISIAVTNVNQAPVLETIGAQSLEAGDDYNLLVHASDPDGDHLRYSATDLPDNSVFAPSTRSFSWNPSNQQAGTHAVTFVVSDDDLQDSETVSFTVVRANEPPVLNTIGAQTVSEGDLLQFNVSTTTESENFDFSGAGLPAGASFDTASKTFSWTPDYDQAGSFTATFTVTDGTDTDSEDVAITVYDTNRSPVISGSPNHTASVGQTYQFAPSASDPDADTLEFAISELPFWASFDPQTGVLSGTPVSQDVGVSSNIVISVSDGSLSASLPAFSIEVVAGGEEPEPNYVDGEIDSDSDGIPDSRDGFPDDPTRSDWVIYASAGTGGYIDPAGETSVLYGGSQGFEIIPATGYYINDLLVNGSSVGLVETYDFTDVDSHHTIEAIFSDIPAGLSQNPLEPGLRGIERTDGGDDSSNLVDGKPSFDLDYRFHVVLRDEELLDQYRVFAVINGYRYALEHDHGALEAGARFSMTTRLGPVHSHRYYFVAENHSGAQLWRYPATGDLPGPVVELLSGHNMIGLVGNINPHGLTANELLGVRQVYRWSPAAKKEGDYVMVDNGAPVSSGEGYQLRRSTEKTLPNLRPYGEVAADYYEFDVLPGWNLIANPYGGNVLLEHIQVRAGEAAPLDWLTAASQLLVVDSLFAYLGEDWGGGNEVTSAAGTNRAILVPGIGYWIYVNPVNQPVSLLIPRPLK